MATKKKNEPGYQDAIDEIDTILRGIESDELDIDQLAPMVERAAHLIAICRERLTATDVRVADALEKLAEVDGDTGDA